MFDSSSGHCDDTYLIQRLSDDKYCFLEMSITRTEFTSFLTVAFFN